MKIPPEWESYLAQKGQAVEIVEQFHYREWHLTTPVVGFGQWFSIAIPSYESFLLEKIELTGLASDCLSGSLRLQDNSNGRWYGDRPLIHYAIRPRRKLDPPILFGSSHVFAVEINFDGPVSPGLDLLGRPRDIRTFRLILSGKRSRPIQ